MKKPRPVIKLTQSELEDFWAMNIAIEATFVPAEELPRARADGRIQCASFSSTMGTAETFWRKATEHELKWLNDYLVVPPGQQAYETPYEDWADDRDVDGLLWAPERDKQEHQLVANIPEPRHAAAIAECARVLEALDVKFGAKRREPPGTLEIAVRDVMRRIWGFDHETLYKNELRFAVLRVLVAIAWDRPWTPVDVDAFWRR